MAALTQGFSENFASLNRNKRSVTLDLKDEHDRESARRLARSAAVLIENNRRGVMARLGLDYESLRNRSPSLVYCSISAFGQEGPRAGEAGFDLTVQAMSGRSGRAASRPGPRRQKAQEVRQARPHGRDRLAPPLSPDQAEQLEERPPARANQWAPGFRPGVPQSEPNLRRQVFMRQCRSG